MRDILSQAEREPGRGPHSRQADMEGEGGLARQAGGRVLLPPRLGTGLPRPSCCMNVRVGLSRKLSAKELMLLNCGVGKDS